MVSCTFSRVHSHPSLGRRSLLWKNELETVRFGLLRLNASGLRRHDSRVLMKPETHRLPTKQLARSLQISPVKPIAYPEGS